MKSLRVLIAGVTGYLGSQLAHRLVSAKRHTVYGLHRTRSNLDRLASIRPELTLINMDQTGLGRAFQDETFDIVINCLANYGRHTSSVAVVDANLALPLQLLELSVDQNVQVFLNAGTSLPAETNTYALSKNQFSQWLTAYSGKIVAIDAKLEHFYGAGEDEARFISFLIKKFLEPAKSLDLTKGEQKRDFLHINDVTRGMQLLIERGHERVPGYYQVPIGSGNAYLLRDVVETIRRLTENQDTEINYGAVPYREHEVMESQADLQLLTELGWQARIDLETGLRQTIQVYQRNIQQRKIA